MRKCEHCGKEIFEGHVMFELPSFYLCTTCFDKFYDDTMAKYMYVNELQYYTQWEEDDDEDA